MLQTTEIQSGNNIKSTVTHTTDDAVGVPVSVPSHWYIALVRRHAEKILQEELNAQGYQTYLAVQKRLSVTPKGKKKWKEYMVIPAKLFIKCTEKERLLLVKHPFIYRYLTNPTLSGKYGNQRIAIISDKEIDTLRFMLGQSDFPVAITDHGDLAGKEVRVVRGPLKGLNGTALETSSSCQDVIVKLDFLGCAKVTIPLVDIELVK